MNVKQALQKLSEKFPDAKVVKVSYQGSGDSFEDFYDVEVEEGKLKKDDEFIEAADGLLWYAIEHSAADFNNEGSEGSIKFDFENMKLSIDNYYYERVSSPSGEQEFGDDEEDIELKDEEE
jgi:hypothetical protein